VPEKLQHANQRRGQKKTPHLATPPHGEKMRVINRCEPDKGGTCKAEGDSFSNGEVMQVQKMFGGTRDKTGKPGRGESWTLLESKKKIPS